jgi:hypothetical protein
MGRGKKSEKLREGDEVKEKRGAREKKRKMKSWSREKKERKGKKKGDKEPNEMEAWEMKRQSR